jgi:phage anti-repressor protein
MAVTSEIFIYKKMVQTATNKTPAKHSNSDFAFSSRNELPLIQDGQDFLVDARLLHAKLKVKEKFSDWSKRRIEDYAFKEGFDYFRNFGNRSDGKPGKGRNEVYFTIDTAKEVCMVERTEIGRKFRKYFIEAEKELRTKRLYAQSATITDINKKIKPIEINGRKLYVLRSVQELLGYSTKSSTSNVRRCNVGLMVKFNGRAYVSEEYVRLMIHNATNRALRAEVKQASPVLPENFGQMTLNLKGGYHA